jgi:hypothetical protein
MNVSEFRRGFDKCRSFRHLKQSLRGFRVLACEMQRGRKDKVETKGYKTRGKIFTLAGTFLAIRFFEKAGRKMKSIYLILSAALVAMATLWARAAAQGLEPALVSVAVEHCSKFLRVSTRAWPNITSSMRLARKFTMALQHKIARD